jgi:hypothetical protein
MRLNAHGLRNGVLITILAFATTLIGCDVAVPGRPEKVFVSERGRFEVIFPGEPEVVSRSLASDPEPITLNTHTVQTGRPTARYSVFYFDTSGALETPTDLFDSLAEAGLEEIRGYELDRKDIVFRGYPSRVLRVATPDGSFMKVQFIHTGSRVYQVMAYFPSEGRSPEETASTSEPLADKFVNSFKLSTS